MNKGGDKSSQLPGASSSGSTALGVLFTGYMEKRNPVRGSYSKRFLVLTQEAFYWFKRPDNIDLFGEERGSISLSAVLAVSRKDEYSFDIEDKAHGHRYFRYISSTSAGAGAGGGGSAAQCDEWITAIRSAMKKLKEKRRNEARMQRECDLKISQGALASGDLDDEAGDGGDNAAGDRDVVVRMVTLRSKGVEMVLARNPSWDRVIRVPLMQVGDEILISTSNGGNVSIDREFMLEQATLSQQKLHELMVTDVDASTNSDMHTTITNTNTTSTSTNVAGTSAGAGGALIPSSVPGNTTHFPTAGSGLDSGIEVAASNRNSIGSNNPNNDASASAVSAAEMTGMHFVDVPVQQTDIPSSLRMCAVWIMDDVDGPPSGLEVGNPSSLSSGGGLRAYGIDIFRAALKESGDDGLTILFAAMSTVVGVTSFHSLNSSNAMMFAVCMLLSNWVLGHAFIRARGVVEANRNLDAQCVDGSSSSSGGGGSASDGSDDIHDDDEFLVTGAQSFQLIFSGYSFTSPDEPVMQAVIVPERFINAEFGNVTSARKRWEKTNDWREKEGIEDILCEEQPHFHHIKNFYPHYNAGKGKEGHCVYYERPGDLMPQLKQLNSRGIGIKEMMRHWLFVTEFQYEILCKRDQMAKGISIIDVKGVGVFDLMGATMDFVKKSVSVAGEHYPERAKMVYIVNANSIFTTLWAIIKKWVNPVTLKKVRILSPNDTLEGLQESIDISQIPEHYGGHLIYGDDKDGARFHSPEAEGMYELVRKVNSKEITSMDQVWSEFGLGGASPTNTTSTTDGADGIAGAGNTGGASGAAGGADGGQYGADGGNANGSQHRGSSSNSRSGTGGAGSSAMNSKYRHLAPSEGPRGLRLDESPRAPSRRGGGGGGNGNTGNGDEYSKNTGTPINGRLDYNDNISPLTDHRNTPGNASIGGDSRYSYGNGADYGADHADSYGGGGGEAFRDSPASRYSAQRILTDDGNSGIGYR